MHYLNNMFVILHCNGLSCGVSPGISPEISPGSMLEIDLSIEILFVVVDSLYYIQSFSSAFELFLHVAPTLAAPRQSRSFSDSSSTACQCMSRTAISSTELFFDCVLLHVEIGHVENGVLLFQLRDSTCRLRHCRMIFCRGRPV